MSNDLVMSPTITKISEALLKAQRTMGGATKGSKNPFFKSSYADLNSLREACIPDLNANGVAILQPIIQKDGKTFVRTLLLHETGEFIGSDTEVIVAKQNDPQAHGSGISYARRYGLQALVFLAAEDDDGEKAMGRDNKSKSTFSASVSSSTARSDATFKTDVPSTLTATLDPNGKAASNASAEAPKKVSSFRPKKTEAAPASNGNASEGWE